MSLYKDASLVMIPSAYKDGKLYSIRPTDGSGDFTFSRGSNLAATRVDVNGLIEKGRENLLTYSNDFSNAAWVKSNTTFSGDTLTANSGTSYKAVYQVESTQGLQVHYFDVAYVDHQWVQILFGTGGLDLAYRNFDIQNKIIGGGSGYIDSTIQDFGTYIRISIVVNTSAKTAVNLAFVNSSSSTRAEATSSTGAFKLFRSQAELGLVATDYIETGTSAAQSGILEDMPRLDYSGGASCPSLLLEPQRSNLIVNSEYFGGWASVVQGTASAPTITTNYDISPDGKQNATRIQFDLNGGTTLSDRVIIRQSLAIQSDYYFSVWMKSATGSEQKILWHSTADDNETTITSDWQRFEFDRNSTSVGWAGLSLRGSTSSVDTADILVWGFQVERGSYKTSYIPTYGTSQTRSEDEAGTSAISGLVGANGGSLFLEISYPEFNSSSRFSLSDGTYDNLVYSRTQATTNGGKIQFLGGDLLLQTPSDYVSLNTFYKVAIGFEENNAVMYVDGVQIATDTSFTMPSGLDFFNFGTTDASINPLRADIKQVLVFPTRLTNAELAALTS